MGSNEQTTCIRDGHDHNHAQGQHAQIYCRRTPRKLVSRIRTLISIRTRYILRNQRLWLSGERVKWLSRIQRMSGISKPTKQISPGNVQKQKRRIPQRMHGHAIQLRMRLRIYSNERNWSRKRIHDRTRNGHGTTRRCQIPVEKVTFTSYISYVVFDKNDYVKSVDILAISSLFKML